MCNTFCQEGVIRICITVVLFCMWSEQCMLPPDRWIRWRCTVEPRGWTSSSSSSSALFPCRWWWRPGPRLSRAREEPGNTQASICTNEIVFFFLCNCLTSTRCVIENSKNSQLGVEERRGSWSVSVKSGALSEVTLQLWVRVRKQPESHVSYVLREELCRHEGKNVLQQLRSFVTSEKCILLFFYCFLLCPSFVHWCVTVCVDFSLPLTGLSKQETNTTLCFSGLPF